MTTTSSMCLETSFCPLPLINFCSCPFPCSFPLSLPASSSFLSLFHPVFLSFRFSLIFSLLCLPHLLLFSSLFLLLSFPLFFPSLCQRKLGTPCHFFHIGYALTNTARTHNFDAGSYFDIVNCFNVAQHVASCAGPRNRRTHRAEC